MNRATLFGTILILIVFFIAINMVAGFGLRGARIDATEGSIYTLTQGSRNIARSPEEPVKLTLYYSAKLAQGKGNIPTYAQRVRETLEEYERASGGKITLTIIDPEPFSEAEDLAMTAGVTGVPVSASGENLYFGLVGTNSADGKEVITFFDPSKERFLEYDLSKLIYSLANPQKKIVGLVSALSLEGGWSMDPATRQPRQAQPWQIATEIKNTFELKNLGKDVKSIADDVSVLLVVHPKDLSDTTLYAIDQYVMKGGKAMIFVDPSCEADIEQQQQQQPMPGQKTSNLNRLLNAWGVEVTTDRFAADVNNALRVTTRPQSGGAAETVPYLAYLQLKDDLLTKEDPVTGHVRTLNFATPGYITAFKPAAPAAKEGDTPTAGLAATIAPLARTSDRAMEMPTALVMAQSDPKQLLKEFTPGSESLVTMARLGGRVRSAFPEGRPAATGETPEDAEKAKAGFLSESKEPMNVILVADVDILSDRMWVQVQNFLGQRMAQKIADNGDMVLTALDNLCGSTDLISVRARRESSRPFSLVEKMQQQADQKYLEEQQALEQKVEETQAKISQLQADKKGEDAFILTPEQQLEIDKLRTEYADTRKQLREVKGSLRKDIEKLGTQLKFINIGLIPVLVSIGAVGLGAYRVSRRKSKPRD